MTPHLEPSYQDGSDEGSQHMFLSHLSAHCNIKSKIRKLNKSFMPTKKLPLEKYRSKSGGQKIDLISLLLNKCS